MFRYPKPIDELIQTISKLQGVGKKTAERLTLELFNWKEYQLENFGEQLSSLKKRVFFCERCFNFSEQKLCSICQDETRDSKIICILESASGVRALEESGSFFGLYHILGGKLSPLEGISPQHLNIASLLRRVKDNQVSEVILALSSDIEGEATSSYISSLLEEQRAIKITRLALGVPIGTDLNYADSSTLAVAIEKRQSL